jgi:RNA polymerase sigma-70 factor (ECF subfamily)
VDRNEFDRLLLQHLDAILRYAQRLVGRDVHSAEDLAQEAALKASRAWRSFGGRSSFKTWVFQIVTNAFRDRLRRREHTAELTDEAATTEIDVARAATDAEIGHIVACAIASLPPRQREVLVLMTYEGLSGAEAAQILGISEQNARVNLHHARENLKLKVRPYLGDAPVARGNSDDVR